MVGARTAQDVVASAATDERERMWKVGIGRAATLRRCRAVILMAHRDAHEAGRFTRRPEAGKNSRNVVNIDAVNINAVNTE